MENQQLNLAFSVLNNTGMNLFLTGKAGTGKTTFLRSLRTSLHKRFVVVAPTGVAAINAGGVTIHSFFQLAFGPYLPDQPNAATQNNWKNKIRKEKINMIRSLDLLVIDEISMVRADVLDAISDVLRRYKDPTKPFGGVQLLLIGDMHQLAPVAKEDEWQLLKAHYATPFFFESHALKESSYYCIELTKVYRQSDTRFVDLLNKIRNNQCDETTLAALNQRYQPQFKPGDADDYITLTTHNYQADAINRQALSELPGQVYAFRAKIDDDYPEYLYPTDAELNLKTGAQVMFVKNDPSVDKLYYNGKIGKITRLSAKGILVTASTGEEIEVQPERWDNIKYTIHPETKEITEEITGSFTQFPLKTAWAITIHKSQGLTFDHAMIDAASAFSHGQVYVALSRCRTLEGLILRSPLSPQVLIRDRQIENFSDNMEARTPGEQQLAVARQQYYTQLICELFDFGRFNRLVQQLNHLLKQKLGMLYPEIVRQFNELSEEVKTKLFDIGNRFSLQLRQLIAQTADYEQNEMIQDRVIKGVAYFEKQLLLLLAPFVRIQSLEVDNKETAKQLDQLTEQLADEIHLKNYLLKGCTSGFTISRYLKYRAEAPLDEEDATSTGSSGVKTKVRKKKEKEPDKIVVSDDIQHPDLYNNIRKWRYGIAAEKQLPVYTILQQKALLGIVNSLPDNERDLLRIPGIGKKIAGQYGEELLQLVQDYKKTLSE